MNDFVCLIPVVASDGESYGVRLPGYCIFKQYISLLVAGDSNPTLLSNRDNQMLKEFHNSTKSFTTRFKIGLQISGLRFGYKAIKSFSQFQFFIVGKKRLQRSRFGYD